MPPAALRWLGRRTSIIISRPSSSSSRYPSFPPLGRDPHPSDLPHPAAPVDISLFAPLLDAHPEASGPYHTFHFPFAPPLPPDPALLAAKASDSSGSATLMETLPPHTLSVRDIRDLHRYPLVIKRVVNQTGKGKIASMYMLVVVGNGKGLVGMGEGKDVSLGSAAVKAFNQAVKNMAPVHLAEGRTVHGEMSEKFHATHLVLRPRPAGFGLRCNPYVHQVAKAAGIQDLSAKVSRNTNPMNVIKLTLKMLHAGSAPLGMGDGFGGKAIRLEKGVGMRTADELACLRGRRAREAGPEDFM